jgi:hypothetical protein
MHSRPVRASRVMLALFGTFALTACGAETESSTATIGAETERSVVAEPHSATVSKPCPTDVDDGAKVVASGDAICLVHHRSEQHRSPAAGTLVIHRYGDEMAAVGLDPCSLPDAFAVPSASTRPLAEDSDRGGLVVGYTPAEAAAVEGALRILVGEGGSLSVDRFDDLSTTVYVLENPDMSATEMAVRSNDAMSELSVEVEVPSCALDS